MSGSMKTIKQVKTPKYVHEQDDIQIHSTSGFPRGNEGMDSKQSVTIAALRNMSQGESSKRVKRPSI
jgi:hypothetical protein